MTHTQDEQRALAESALAQACSRFPHEESGPVTVMPEILKQRFDQLLALAKDPRWPVIARENIAAARELADTLHIAGLLDTNTWRAHLAECNTAQLVVSAAELKRAEEARRRVND
jgi:hypothetical protein